jgi:hypothetical protein
MSAKLIDIAFLIGSGRVNVEIEEACFAAVSAEGMADFTRKMRSASCDTISAVWSIVKATPAGSELK